MSAITPIHVQVALKSGITVDEFTFSRDWSVPRTVFQLSAGHLALSNITFLVPDDSLACEDLLIGYPVLKNLKID